MSDFKAKMHQIQFRLGFRPRPRWGSLQRSPDPIAGFKGPYFREGEGWKEEREGKEDKGRDPQGLIDTRHVPNPGKYPGLSHNIQALPLITALFHNVLCNEQMAKMPTLYT